MLQYEKYLRAKYLKMCTVKSELRFYQQIIYIWVDIKYQL